MLLNRRKLAVLLLIGVGISFWLLKLLTDEDKIDLMEFAHFPDYYMHDFSTLTMTEEGKPKNLLEAEYMAHYPDDNTTELTQPRMKFFRLDEPPMHVRADKGWVTSDNEVILLTGNVYLYQNDAQGNRDFELIADDARVLVDEDYAETDNAATVIKNRTVINAIGMRAYMAEQRMEFLSNVQTTIEPKREP
ncbi:MAG: LPS export ABC transporter periplasmic protein LptC [Pseudomonadota bacterium]